MPPSSSESIPLHLPTQLVTFSCFALELVQNIYLGFKEEGG